MAADVLSWRRELGRQRSVIELDTPSMTAQQIDALERSVNEKIRARIPVTVRELPADDPEIETVSGGERTDGTRGTETTAAWMSPCLPLSPFGQVRSRGLPDDHAGPVRVVDIEGVDSNMCCGTHVSNLSDLQVRGGS